MGLSPRTYHSTTLSSAPALPSCFAFCQASSSAFSVASIAVRPGFLPSHLPIQRLLRGRPTLRRGSGSCQGLRKATGRDEIALPLVELERSPEECRRLVLPPLGFPHVGQREHRGRLQREEVGRLRQLNGLERRILGGGGVAGVDEHA